MIKAEDLRIGDLVRVCRNCAFPEGTVCTILEIVTIKVFDAQNGLVHIVPVNGIDNNFHGVWCKDIEGIPLTPEILEKNGFKEEIVGEYYTKSLKNEEYSLARYLAVERKSCNWAVFIRYRNLPDHVLIRHIQHVHELQHILWALSLDAEFKI